MAGLDPALHSSAITDIDVDGRLKAGHDGWGVETFCVSPKTCFLSPANFPHG